MSRYIDADALAELLKDERDFYKKMCDYMQQPCEQDERAIIGAYYTAYSKSYHMAKDAPTVDAVPVVRCGECKHWIRNEDYSYVGRCELWNVDFENDFYCADGERKDDE